MPPCLAPLARDTADLLAALLLPHLPDLQSLGQRLRQASLMPDLPADPLVDLDGLVEQARDLELAVQERDALKSRLNAGFAAPPGAGPSAPDPAANALQSARLEVQLLRDQLAYLQSDLGLGARTGVFQDSSGRDRGCDGQIAVGTRSRNRSPNPCRAAGPVSPCRLAPPWHRRFRPADAKRRRAPPPVLSGREFAQSGCNASQAMLPNFVFHCSMLLKILVPAAGLEPARPSGLGILSPLCLPFHHAGNGWLAQHSGPAGTDKQMPRRSN